MPLINCKISLELRSGKNCVLSSQAAAQNNVTFTITDTKLYVPIVTLSSKDTSHLSNLLREGFKRSVFWNEYKTKTDKRTENINDYIRIMLNSSIQGVNRLFVLPSAADADDLNNITVQQANENNRNSYRKFYLPRTTVNNYNVLIDGRNFYDQPIDNNERQYDELRKVTLGKGDDYTTGCLLDYAYFKNNYKIIAVDLSKQNELDTDPRAIQQIEFVGTVANTSAIVTILESSKETVLEFFKGTAKII